MTVGRAKLPYKHHLHSAVRNFHWSWSLNLLLLMGPQDPHTFIHRPSTLLQTVFIAALVLVTSCYASPLSLVPPRLERTATTVSDMDLSLYNDPDYDYSSRRAASMDESNFISTVHPRHLQLDSRDLGWSKALDKLAMKIDGMALIGYSYAEEFFAKEFRGRFFPLENLTLPGTDRPLSTTNHLYLVSKPNALVNKLELSILMTVEQEYYLLDLSSLCQEEPYGETKTPIGLRRGRRTSIIHHFRPTTTSVF
ncbi:uncharacterized protein C8R40DRAFT_417736 [Lentinula edodes]|uniref:uncharacterized protein n=1 Tax=Lentinula edodes TaxID=5353 RepID=UPI001E8E0420|nr:uncharacterized protein C8R40DRAFT_417736 [Lentinula edodes]KAH7872764.1 hypothetical protein C8R40DRAFT_417736 [Lentinula edodes]